MQLTEAQVRALRDEVYGGTPSSDKNWEGCKDAWMQPDEILWLQRAKQRAADLKVLKINTI
jgi:hypothetical protein